MLARCGNNTRIRLRLPFKPRPELDPTMRVDLCTDNDIVGGNSGSPLIDSAGHLVGLIFDGNIHSIGGAFWFDAARARAIAAHPAMIRAALSKVYGAEALLRELEETEAAPPAQGTGPHAGAR